MSQNRDLGYKSLENDPRVQASIRRLKAMGLKFETTVIDKDTIAIGFDIESIIRYIERTLYSNITYPNKYVFIDRNLNVLMVFISRSAERIKDIMSKLPDIEQQEIEKYARILREKGEAQGEA